MAPNLVRQLLQSHRRRTASSSTCIGSATASAAFCTMYVFADNAGQRSSRASAAGCRGRRAYPPADSAKGYLTFEDNDLAVEWCENRLLDAIADLPSQIDSLLAFPLFEGMAEPTLAQLQRCVKSVEYPAAATIIAAGQEHDDRVFLIRDGEVSVVLSLANGAHQRIATLSSGMTFGEMVMLGQAARSANVHADTAVRCWTLSTKALDELAVAHPEIKIAVLTNLSRDLRAEIAAGQSADRGLGGVAAGMMCNWSGWGIEPSS